MNYRMLGYLLSIILLIEAALLLIPTGVAIGYGESPLPFLITIAILVIISLPSIIFKPENKRIFAREGFICAASAWVLLSAFGALPFVISGAIPNYIDAFFETVSGLTTTGATLLTEIESLPKGILFWRSLTHWIGGMGVLVFMLAIIPSKDGQSMHLMRAEVPGPQKGGKLVPKTRQTAIILYGIYIALTVIMTICLLLCGLSVYDSTVIAISTAGTGGFSVLNSSIAGYANVTVEWIVSIFMLLFSVNFNLYFFLLIGRGRDILHDEELKVFLGLTAVSTALIAVNTRSLFDKLGDCIRTAFFQVTSIMSTTGFATVDFNNWPAFSKTLLMLLLITGACAGSTAGGLKLSRIIILIKSIVREIKHILRPRSVNVIRLNKEPLDGETVRSALGYLAMYFFIMLASILLISLDGFDFETNATSVLTCINNVGPGLGELVGPCGNFSYFSGGGKLLLSLDMLLGRLEIVPMVVLLSPSTWKRK